jgi:hypothetical protein
LRVAVIGAGIQGVGIALELSRRGASVDLIEKRDACLTRASLHNEGKIHLGFIYANDRSLATARLMMDCALQFEPILTDWLEAPLPDGLVSSPFDYVVHRDSLIDEETLGAYYRTVSDLIRSAADQRGRSYFGIDAGAAVRRMTAGEQDGVVDPSLVRAVFRTPEHAIASEPVAELLRARVAQERRITLHLNTSVGCVSREADRVFLTADGPEEIRKRPYDHIVNASWEGRLAIDATAGIRPPGRGSFRIKHFLRIRGPVQTLHPVSVSVVLGGFGDVVQYGTGDLFLSWYPVSRRGMSCDLVPPPWPLPLQEPEASEARVGIHQGLGAIMPWLHGLPADAVAGAEVQGGIIYALGATDVDDPGSQLHERSRVGPQSFGRYHTVDTGKYTLAPFFARVTAERILGGS